MSFLAPFLLTLPAAASTANPLPQPTTRVARRDNPSPSTYPLGDACGNEWQYLNFDPKNGADMSHLGTLHKLICSGEIRAYIGWGLNSANKRDQVYKDFFEDDDDTNGNVVSVPELLQGPDEPGRFIGDVVGSMVIDNLGKLLSPFPCRLPVSDRNTTLQTLVRSQARDPTVIWEIPTDILIPIRWTVARKSISATQLGVCPKVSMRLPVVLRAIVLLR